LGSRRATVRLLASLAVLGLIMLWSFLYLRPASPGHEISLDELTTLINQKQVATARLLDEDARLVLTAAPGATVPGATSGATATTAAAPLAAGRPAAGTTGATYWVAYPKSDTATSDLI